MKHNILICSLLILAGMFAPWCAAAAGDFTDDDGHRTENCTFTPQHEFRLSAGAFPVISDSSYGYYYMREHLMRRSDTYTAGAWTLSYGYRFTKWFDLSAAVSYYGEYSSLYSNVDNSFIRRDDRHRIGFIPMARFTWLNRRFVRLYSAFGIGVLIDTRRDTFNDGLANITGHLTPIGIAVGGSLFGFGEIGIGTHAALLIGVGYKFNNKKSNR